MDNGVVPIGKYRGQPIERLLEDQPYSEWLLAQSWFLDRYADLAQLMRMGRLSEPQDTPEHNAMIAGLIDRQDEFQWLFAQIYPQDDVTEDWYLAAFQQEIEPKGGDILLRSSRLSCEILIEAKPLIGDDYPSVIRQVKASGRKHGVVIAKRVEPTNLTVEQVRRQFTLAGVKLLLEAEFFAAGDTWRAERIEYVSRMLPLLEDELAECIAVLETGKHDPYDRNKWTKADLERRITLMRELLLR